MPSVTATAPERLADATPLDVVREMWHRKKSAVLITFNTPPSGQYHVDSLRGAGVQCFGTEDMTPLQLCEAITSFGTMSVTKQKNSVAAAVNADQPHELKGDYLGMNLAEFKQKHSRRAPASGQKLPWCSDEVSGQHHPELHTEPGMAAVGIVHCRIDLPFESSPTIAGVNTELLLYQFVDGKLFSIHAQFDTDFFQAIQNSLPRDHAP
jgi:hypothetical protein